MASSNSMEDEAFTDRVKKTFGSLFTSLPPSSLSNPLWSLTDSQIEKREWRRDKDTSARDSNPCSSSFDDFISHARKNSRKNLGNYCNEFDDQIGDGGFHDWDVRSSIGLDSTLDHEEEEDTYDKVAIGRENAGDRLYMKDITDNHSSHVGSRDDLLNTFECKQRDPRANHSAARIRLREDAAEAAAQTEQRKGGQASRAEKNSSASAEDSDKVKPILKRKEHESTSRSSKRVRFDPGCVSNDGGGGSVEITKEASSNTTTGKPISQDNESLLDEKVSRVPDYVRNPSKYKCYNLDSSDDVSDKSNTEAFLDLLKIAKRSKNGGSGSEQADAPVDPPKSISFIPKKKSDTAKANGVHCESTEDTEIRIKPSSLQSTSLVSIAAGEEQETESGEMEIDEAALSSEHDGGTTFRKQGRQYRSKSVID